MQNSATSTIKNFKLTFFLYFACMGAAGPYMALHLHQVGLQDWQIGWVLGTSGLALLIAPSLVGYCADWHFSPTRLIQLLMATSALAIVLICISSRFKWIYVTMLIYQIARAPLSTLLDSAAFELRDKLNAKGIEAPAYHSMRIWGSIGFILPSLVFFLINYLHPVAPRIALLMGVLLMGLALISVFSFPVSNAQAKGTSLLEALRSDKLRQSLNSPALHAFLIFLFVSFICLSVFDSFNARLYSEIGIPADRIGLLINLGVAVEIFVVIYARGLLAAVGLRGILVIGGLAIGARLILLCLSAHPVLIIATQFLHGIIALPMYFVPQMYLDKKLDPPYRNSAQGLFRGTMLGVATCIGPIAAGHIISLFPESNLQGIRCAFFIAAIVSILNALLLYSKFDDPQVCGELQGEWRKSS